MTVYTYKFVEELRSKEIEDIEVSEIRKLEKYVKQKKKVADLPKGDWSKKQLLKAERLLHELKQENEMVIQE